MRVCENCGFDGNRDTARFCAQCGHTLSRDELPSEETVTLDNRVQISEDTIALGSHAPSAEGIALLSRGAVLHDRYRVVRVLGRGGMGAVYLVEDLRLYGKHWAMKELTEHFSNAAERAEGVAQFQHEVEILVGLRHPNLPLVVDAFEAGGRHYLVMEFIEGQTLEEIQKAAPEGQLPEEQALGWTVQICTVLDYLHSHDPPVIFRDLKPSNVMITPRGQVKLIDFGVARLFNPAKGTDTLKMGTAGYAPPEQYAGKGQTTPRSDVYALGATLHELLTGEDPTTHPFVFTPIRRLNRKVSARTARAITRAIQMDPDDRFPSASAMKTALVGGKRRSPAVFLIALPLLLLVAAGGWWLWQSGPWGTAEATPTTPSIAVAQPTSSPTATRRPTSTPAPTLTPTPVPPTDTPSSTPTASPTSTPSATPTPSRTPRPRSSPTPPATPTLEGSPAPTSTPAAPSPAPTPTPLPPPPPGQQGRIFYTIQAGEAYYLASTDPSWSQGQVIGPTSYERSTCGGTSTAGTLEGQTVNLYYGYRCVIGSPKDCLSPDGRLNVVMWAGSEGYSFKIRQEPDGTPIQTIYPGSVRSGDPLIWAPDSSCFYFPIDRTLHVAGPDITGYQPVIPIAYEPYLSPDSSMILYLQPVGTVGAYDIWVTNADGSNPRNVTNAPETYKLCPRWGGY
ncbi:MAG: protein kinase [Anaerolineae bacterium]